MNNNEKKAKEDVRMAIFSGFEKKVSRSFNIFVTVGSKNYAL